MSENTVKKINTSKGQLKREQILAYSRQKLISDGYDAFIMREIAGNMQMTIGNLQYYFPTRESLLETVIRQEAKTDLLYLQTSLESSKNEKEQLVHFVKSIITKWRGDSGIILSTMGFLALHKTSFQAVYKEIYSQFYRELALLIKKVDPGQRTQTYARRARLITALVDGAAMQVQRGGSVDFLNDISDVAIQIAKP